MQIMEILREISSEKLSTNYAADIVLSAHSITKFRYANFLARP